MPTKTSNAGFGCGGCLLVFGFFWICLNIELARAPAFRNRRPADEDASGNLSLLTVLSEMSLFEYLFLLAPAIVGLLIILWAKRQSK